jgi:hypothetical protein
MRTIRRFVIGIFCAVLVMVVGAAGGSAIDDLKKLAPLADTGIPQDRAGLTKRLETELALAEFEKREITCLANIVQSEGDGELAGNRYLIAMVAKSIRDDPSERWGRTFCAIAQKRLFNGVKDPHDDSKLRPQNLQIAAFIYHDPWREQVLPRGWECVRNYAVPEKVIKKLSTKRRAQLGITKAMKGYAYFRSELRPVAEFGRHEAYQSKIRCKNPLPTT